MMTVMTVLVIWFYLLASIDRCRCDSCRRLDYLTGAVEVDGITFRVCPGCSP